MKWHELKKLVGKKWEHATVCIHGSVGGIRLATRVSLHENDDGGLIVVLNEERISNGGFPPLPEEKQE